MTDSNDERAEGHPMREEADPGAAAPAEPSPRKKKAAEGAPAAKATAETPLVPRDARALGLAVLATVALIALDLGTKSWAEGRLSSARVGDPPAVCEAGPSGFAPYQRLREDPIVIVQGILHLEYAENCGAAFSLFGEMPAPLRHAIFYVAAILATIVLSRMFYQGRGGRFFVAAVPMVISGALGNFHDRVRFGYVVDFIHFHWESIGFDYPIFNVADIAVVLGVIALVIDSFRERHEETAAATGAARSEKPA